MSASALRATPLLAAAIAGPVLLAFNEPPSPTALNQAIATGGWGLVLAAMAGPWSALLAAARRGWPLCAALLIAGVCALLSAALAQLPSGLGLSMAGMAMFALVAGAGGTALRPGGSFWPAFFGAWLLAGAASVAISLPQVFAPSLADGDWIARSGIPGRAVGNLRQPNHLATLLLWSAAAVVPMLAWARARGAGRAASVMLASLFALLLFGVVLSGSRTGLVGVGMLALWGLLDARLSRPSRALLIASPLICAASWWLLNLLTGLQDAATPLGATARAAEGLSTTRLLVWRDALALVAQHPWLGVGFGEFNFAWTLTPFAVRSGEFFDHTHNLPLQLAVELGLPLALLVLGLLAWGLWQAFDRTRRVDGFEGTALRTCFVMVLLMALHSQLEYPLWYAYFLLPTAFAWGLCLGAGAPEPPAAAASSGRWVRLAGVAMLIGAAAMLWDYRRVVVIFAPGESAAPLAERIAEGQRSWFFAHHADYALVTTADAPVTQPGAFDRATHYLLDTRLMIAWAQALAARGDVDRARHLAARLREFRNPGSAPFFEPCDDPQVAAKPFQCEPPERAYDWRDFRH